MNTTLKIAAVLVIAAGARFAAAHEGHHDEAAEKAAAPAQPAAAETVQGEVLDMACYLPHGGSGKGHASCGVKCLKGGAPAGLLKADGSVIWLADSHEKDKGGKAWKKVADLAGKQAKVTGTMVERGGAKALLVESIEEAK